MIGENHDSRVFPVSRSHYSVTHETTIECRYFKGDPSRPIRVIDTQGFNDPGSAIIQKHTDHDIQLELMTRLGDVDGVHLFVICVNAANPRIPPSLVRMIESFLKLYGYRVENGAKVSDPEEFWKRCVLNFTRFAFNEVAVRNRRKTGESKSQLNVKIQEKLENLFGYSAQGLKHFFIDSFYSKDNPEEVKMFEKETENLYRFLVTKPAARTFALKLAEQTPSIVEIGKEYQNTLFSVKKSVYSYNFPLYHLNYLLLLQFYRNRTIYESHFKEKHPN